MIQQSDRIPLTPKWFIDNGFSEERLDGDNIMMMNWTKGSLKFRKNISRPSAFFPNRIPLKIFDYVDEIQLADYLFNASQHYGGSNAQNGKPLGCFLIGEQDPCNFCRKTLREQISQEGCREVSCYRQHLKKK